MKKSLLILFIVLLTTAVYSQEKDWERLQTDDGEMALKMPAGCYSNFYNRDGITVYDSANRDRYYLTEMRLISCYRDGTLMSLEIYDTRQARSAARVLQKNLNINGNELNVGEKFYAVEQNDRKDGYVSSQRLIAGKKRVYIVTTATRGEPNETMRTFLDSIGLAADSSNDAGEKSVLISSLENAVPELVTQNDVIQKKSALPEAEMKTLKNVVAISKPAASYTAEAQSKKTRGKVVLRLTLSGSGRISRLQVVRDLPYGLVREAVMAAMRIKFLPAELNGSPRSTTQLIEYNFGVY